MQMDLIAAKFAIRVALTLIITATGITIFFVSDTEGYKIFGSNLITMAWGTWFPSPKTKSKTLQNRV